MADADNKKAKWVGFDLGGTKMLAHVLNSSLKTLGTRRRRTRGRGADGDEAGVDRIVDTIEDAMAAAGVDRDELAGIGMACPGPLDLDRGIVLDTPNLGWKDVPIRSLLEKKFKCPVVISNDVDAGVFGEYRLGAARKARCVLGVFPGTGIGGGCVYEGRLLRGKVGSCLEIGHMQVVADGPLCGCGKRGCLESVASRTALAAAAATAVVRGDAPKLRDIAGTDLADIRSGALAAAVDGGDKVIAELVRQASGWIGIAVANAVNLLAPDVVVLGGGLVEAMPKLICDEVAAVARRRVMDSFKGSFSVVAAELGDDATVKGAAAWAQTVLAVRDKE